MTALLFLLFAISGLLDLANTLQVVSRRNIFEHFKIDNFVSPQTVNDRQLYVSSLGNFFVSHLPNLVKLADKLC